MQHNGLGAWTQVKHSVADRYANATAGSSYMSDTANAKAEVNQFYQRCKSHLPKYEVKGTSGAFKCTLICPSVHTDEGSVELQFFTGKGPNKKACQAAAASEALKFLQQQRLYTAKKPHAESLWHTVKGSMSGQVIIPVIDTRIFAQYIHIKID